MITSPVLGSAGMRASRRRLYRQSKRLLLQLVAGRWSGLRHNLEPAVRGFLRARSRNYLLHLAANRAFALAAAATLLAIGTVRASPPIYLSDVAEGDGGFVINGLDAGSWSSRMASGAGDVNGDGVPDVILGSWEADPGGNTDAGESYVVFGKADGKPVDVSDIIGGVGGFAIIGTLANARSGLSVSGAGDVNGDGLDDVIVGAPYAHAGYNYYFRGESYVVFGKADTAPVDLADVIAGNGGFVINGWKQFSRSGWSVSGAGDVNGDGLGDVIVGTRLHGAKGESYVVFGKADTAPVDLADVVGGVGGFVINGIEFKDYSGWSVSGAGDVNGDGLDDVIVGAPFPYYGGPGESYVVFGKPDGTPVELADVAAGDGGFVINGTDENGRLGISVSVAGDVNGDGLDDLVVGAPSSGQNTGNSYVVFGKADTTAVDLADVVAGDGGFVMNGMDSFGDSGFSVSGAGDVNGDGLDDVIVGAPQDDINFGGPGKSFVVFGKADTAAVNLWDVAAGDGGFIMYGGAGTSVSGAGDVNGDGLDDVIVANPGRGYVVFSPEVSEPCVPLVKLADVAAGDGGFIMNGIDPDDQSGRSVSGAGDVNGDGVPDVIVGAPGSFLGTERPGESYVVFGKADTAAVDLADVVAGNGGFVISGIDPDDLSGSSVSGAGDVNGDGLDDVIVGAWRADPGGNEDAGESYVVFGKVDTQAVNLADVVAGNGGFVMNGIDSDDYSGRSVSGAGDINGDGLDDLIVGAPHADPGGNSRAGESYVVFGKADGTPVDLADVATGIGGFVISGIANADRSGFSVSGAGDVNGDGLDDVIVGAPSDAGPSNPGESYVVFGKADTAAVNLSDVVAGDGGFVVNGIDQGDESGFSVSGAGDVNGDGLADVIVGAPQAHPGGISWAGESYVVFGKADTAAVNLADVAGGDGGFVMYGSLERDFSGQSVSGAGDVNGDGLDDVIVGAPLYNHDFFGPGKSYVVFGKADTAAVELADIAACGAGFVILSIHDPDDADHAGGSVSEVGDVNGDGLDDVIVGNRFGDGGAQPFSGESYVVFSPVVWGDLNGDGSVGASDLLLLLASWGRCPEPCVPYCPGDLNRDCSVGATDLLMLLVNWG